MRAFQTVCALLLAVAASAYAEDLDDFELDNSYDPRLFVANFTSSLIQVNATILAYGLIAIAIAAAALVALTFLFMESANSESSYGQYNQYSQYSNYARSADFGYGGLSVLQWISMLQDVYENFDYNDLDCQKRLICEVMKQPDYYGSVAKKFKSGFQYAKYLEVLSLPDDMRELLDEYLDANARADQQKECAEFFQCPYSIQDSMKRNVADGNHL